MSGQGPTFTAYLDFAQVDRGLEQTTKRSEGAVLAYGKLEGAMQRTEVQSKKLGTYLQQQFVPQFAKLDDGLTRSGKGFWNLEGGAKALQQRLAPQAAAISGISSALGENAGQAGKAVAGLGQLAAAYAAGGPWGAVLAAAGVGATLLVKYWDDVIVKQDQALMKAYSGVDAATALRQKAEADIASLQLASLSPEKQAFQAVEVEITAVEKRIEAAKQAFKNNRVDESTLSASMSPAKRQEAIDAQDEMKKRYDVEISQLEKTVDLLRQKQFLQGKNGLLAGLASGKSPATGKKSDRTAISFYDDIQIPISPDIADNTARLDALRRPAFAQADRDDEEFDRQFRMQADYAQRVTDLNQWAAEQTILAHQRVGESMNKIYGDALSGVLGNATGALNNFFVGMATGQKHAFEEAAAGFLSSTGQQLVGLGTKAIWEGAIISANPGTPGAGVPMIALGLGAIGAGMAMGAAGGALSASIPSGASSSRGSEDRGVSSGFSGRGGSSDAGGVNIYITYGAVGPAPEQGGRELARLGNTLRLRQGLPLGRQGPGGRL